MNVLLDSNILLRLVQVDHPQHALATTATDLLVKSGHSPCTVSQNLYEFWAVASRPKVDNGIGYGTARVDAELTKLEQLFTLFADTEAVATEWRKLVVAHDCKGKPSHDARLVAAMNVHGIRSLMTFNTPDFGRYAAISVITPQDLVDGKFRII